METEGAEIRSVRGDPDDPFSRGYICPKAYGVKALHDDPRCTLVVHPDDATRLGLVAGGTARVTSRVGELLAPVDISDAIMPGVVSLPHGFGHDLPGMRMAVARDHAGVNINILSDDARLDAISGNAAFNGVAVTVTACP